MKRTRETKAQQHIIDVAVVRLIQGKRLEVQGPGSLVVYMGSVPSHINRRDPYWYEHPGGRTYKEEPLQVVRAVLPHVGYRAIEEAKVYNNGDAARDRMRRRRR